MIRDRRRVVVLGYVVRQPVGGLVWHYLQYALGLAQLGHEVLYLEDGYFLEDDAYAWYYDPTVDEWRDDPTYGLAFLDHTFMQVGLAGRWACFDAHRSTWHGLPVERVLDFCRSADLLFNVSAVNPVRPWLETIPVRVFVDTDPAFSQLRILRNAPHRRLAEQHNVFASFGENLPAGRSSVPLGSMSWIPTRQPIVLDAWTPTPGRSRGAFTTVMAWETYRAEAYQGRRFGLKSDSFQPYVDLPQRTKEILEVWLAGATAPARMLREAGWKVNAGGPRDPWEYQRYLRESKGEFSVAKEGYVVSRSGWFSERSAAYLASGRPVVVQDTGFSDWMETGRGVLGFRTAEEAAAGLEEVGRDYERHCRAARMIASEYFDARTVLSKLIERAEGAHNPVPSDVADA